MLTAICEFPFFLFASFSALLMVETITLAFLVYQNTARNSKMCSPITTELSSPILLTSRWLSYDESSRPVDGSSLPLSVLTDRQITYLNSVVMPDEGSSDEGEDDNDDDEEESEEEET